MYCGVENKIQFPDLLCHQPVWTAMVNMGVVAANFIMDW
jgi:hypothetical protein